VDNIFIKFFNFPLEVARCLSDICCYNEFVVQGALTSSYIASLCLFDIEPEIVNRIERKGLVYTRLVDDITVSSKSREYDYSLAKDLIVQMLHTKDLPVNLEKTTVTRTSAEPLLIHGLRVSYKEPRLPSKEISRIRASVKNIERLASEPKFRLTHAYRKDFNRCIGRVNKLHRVGHKQHRALIQRLMRVYPKASTADVERVKISIDRLERDYATKNEDYWYYKRFHRAQERLNLIKRSFPNLALRLRARLTLVKPEYDE
jgi:RNA-directed DNA polymerase